jgi:predicted nuclease of predicted toxin-antitoxin system
MSLRFFADHCVPTSVIRTLRDGGHEVLILREHLSQDASDAAVVARVRELNAILVSLNGDFADIVTYPPSKYEGIIALQVKNHPEVIPALMQRLMKYLIDQPEMSHYRGKLLVVEAHRIRIRK